MKPAQNANKLLTWYLPKSVDPDQMNKKMEQAKSLAANVDNADGVDRNPITDMLDIGVSYGDDVGSKKLTLDQRNPDTTKLSLLEEIPSAGRRIDMETQKSGKTSIMQTDFIIVDGKQYVTDKQFFHNS